MADTSKPAGRLGPVFHPPGRAAYATFPDHSRGRLFPEPESATRTCYQRDRDRILHSTAFRRLKHKTQVFVEHEGDYYRTRMTHSLEVAQIARSASRVLALDEDLAEAVALAHDLGHTPFGHTGEEALDAATEEIGGFDHNAHALRLVARLEHRYARFDGLNLTWETLEGLVKHNGPLTGRIPEPIARFNARWSLELTSWPGLEAQVAALSDDIAYLTHDIDDGLRAGLFSVDELLTAPLAGPRAKEIMDRYGELEASRFIGELVSRLIGDMVADLLTETQTRLAAAKPGSVAEVRGAGRALASFSERMGADAQALKDFLFVHMYRHKRVTATRNRAKALIAELFGVLAVNPALLPPGWAATCGAPADAVTKGVVRDYIAGMTDGYAIQEYRRIFHKDVRL
ncbi:deoxyguanosinetriphosphate triphosphohydrolase [Rhizomicrobium electricum]|uniref:Deoxyguanosinetriphosphate triphosphohydrolase-like protein n=1 Tax=Rhizomicrobium electricum TaxID=480070 RepID=A0ABN1E0Z5_9PROT|nr:deoxyguanosinetriphosphate triphosphohydrolase [Rhizomicrobium electricum]NIJ47375.1 dGTPase [Rhizomicrobium electricum]